MLAWSIKQATNEKKRKTTLMKLSNGEGREFREYPGAIRGKP